MPREVSPAHGSAFGKRINTMFFFQMPGDPLQHVGNTALMDHEKVDWKALATKAEEPRAEGASVMYLAADWRLVGLFGVFRSNHEHHF